MAMEPIKGLRMRNSAAGTGTGTASITSSSHQCGGCGQMIKDRYLLQALDVYWHEDCLKCGCCDCRLGEVGSTLYTRANLILCKRDYLRLFGATGSCAACCKVIPAFEMVMRAKNNVYHLECFACSCCQQRFCVGDRFYLCDNRILCQYDYEERIIFANLTPGAAAVAPQNGAPPQPVAGPSESASSGQQRSNRGHWGRNPATPCDSRRPSDAPPAVTSGPAAGGSLTAPKQDSPTGGDASSSGYGSPDSGLIDEG